jgi:hypothetical protein
MIDQTPLEEQIEFLNNEFKVVEELLLQTQNKMIDSNDNKNDFTRNSLIENENADLKNKLCQQICISNNLVLENKCLKEKLLKQNQDITCLQDQLKFARNERDENICKLQNFLKDFDFFNSTPGSVSYGNIEMPISGKTLNPSSYNNIKHYPNQHSISTVYSQSTNNTNTSEMIEKLSKENLQLESKLVMYKLKFAEQSSKLLGYEENYLLLKKKIDTLNETLKMKEEIIKNIISERDNLKYPQNNTNHTPYMTDETITANITKSKAPKIMRMFKNIFQK